MWKALICRLLNTHKWVRLETSSEEAHQCRRCGKRHFGKRPETDLTAFTGGGSGPPF